MGINIGNYRLTVEVIPPLPPNVMMSRLVNFASWESCSFNEEGGLSTVLIFFDLTISQTTEFLICIFRRDPNSLLLSDI